MRNVLLQMLFISLLISCSKGNGPQQQKKVNPPNIEEGGKKIIFQDDPETLSFFAFDTVRNENIEVALSVPATVAVTITISGKGGRPIVLFDNPVLEATYSQFLQHLININTYRITLNRLIDLSKHGAASGKEVLEGETQLRNEEAALTEQEGELKIEGMDPDKLRKPESIEAWLLCEVPETQIGNIKTGGSCKINFTAFPGQDFKGVIDGLGSEVDNITRMNKVRVVLPNSSGKFKVGMFAKADFQLSSPYTVAIPISAVVNVQGKDYAFTKSGKTGFERREILTGYQSEGKVVVLNGLQPGELIAVKGAMELKGLSFGY